MNDDLIITPTMFLFEEAWIGNGNERLLHRRIMQGEPPEDFAEYTVMIGGDGKGNQLMMNGQPAQFPVNFNAPTPEAALAMIPEIAAKTMRELTKPKLQLVPGAVPMFNGHNRMNGHG